ncbi:MAG: DUF3794 domain-containing protein, partial [Clostridia bacterium]|nr:DUF3794 domain-containing protein [Clostridia bacterium]
MPNHVQLDLVRRLLKVENVIGERAAQQTVVNEVTFPERVKKIWDVQADIRDIRFRIIPDKVIVEGIIHKQIFWVREQTNEVFEKTVEDSFVAHVDIPGARPGMNAQVETLIEFIKHDPIIRPTHKPTPTPTPT